MGIRVLVAERKSRKPSADKAEAENTRYRRQELKNIRTAEAAGHVVVHREADTVSSQTLPWRRKNLKAWFSDPAKLAMWDAVLISEVSRISRGDSDTWFEIEQWCRANGKFIMNGRGLMWPDADDEKWDAERRAARDYYESVRDSHAEARADVLAAKAAIGRPPFGYTTAAREDGYKAFVVDPVTGPIALQVFRKIIDGETASAVAEWLGEQTGQGSSRAQRVIKMIRSNSYLGERDGHAFPTLAPNMADLVDTARAALDARSFDHGGNRVTHAYSSRIFCRCGCSLNHHQSSRGGQPVGTAKYRCSRGRRGIAGEARCKYGAFPFDATNIAVEAEVGALTDPDGVMVTTGGDAQKQAKLDALAKQIERAVKARDYARAGELQADYAQAEATSGEVTARLVLTGKTLGERFTDGDLDQRRAMLVSGQFRVFVLVSGVRVEYLPDDGPEIVAYSPDE